ncbi:MAG: formate/nitrite transporter family protein [Actinobacteria bacterium]|nr:formate/nitrite transporter family protein [Actinomycetota bacterium]
MANEVSSQFQSTIEEGENRLSRSLPSLLATGAVGGIDVGIGVFALLLVKESTHNDLLAGLAFGIGFIALTLANSELFTENFLVPIVTVTTRRARPLAVLRLWLGTASTNLLGGWLIMAVVLSAVPQVRETAVESATHYTDLGLGWESFASAILGGAVITLMTWMERGSKSEAGRLVAAVVAAFLLGAGKLTHAIVVSLLLFAGLQAGAPYGYLDWLGFLGWATLGNMVGGIGLITVLRLIQVGKASVTPQSDLESAGAMASGEGASGEGSAAENAESGPNTQSGDEPELERSP